MYTQKHNKWQKVSYFSKISSLHKMMSLPVNCPGWLHVTSLSIIVPISQIVLSFQHVSTLARTHTKRHTQEVHGHTQFPICFLYKAPTLCLVQPCEVIIVKWIFHQKGRNQREGERGRETHLWSSAIIFHESCQTGAGDNWPQPFTETYISLIAYNCEVSSWRGGRR